MTREEITRIAREVGFDDGEIETCQLMFEHFAFLVARAVREADMEYERSARKFFADKGTQS